MTRNLQPLMEGLVQARVDHLFHVYVLSDSSDPDIIAAETSLVDALAAKWQGIIPVTYRRRAINTAFKSGNIRDFCDRWGGNHDYAITLDADSFMPADAVLRLIRIAQANPTLGILQTLIIGMPSVSVFARVFQFGMRLGMRSYTLGATWWQGDCGPYWGHNAVIRLAPFIAHCRMPMLPGNGPLSGHVLSHDQIEAVLMRRAGYEVRVLPVEGMSWEENPPTLMEFSRRDLRWCQGNMQYWQLLSLPGLKPVSRFQLLFAIWMYLGSPAWMAMTAIGTVLLALSNTPAAQYVPVKAGVGTVLFAIMMLMTFAPKIATIIDVMLTPSTRRSFGGALAFAANIAVETAFMILLVPTIALMHTIFMTRLFVFRRGGTWNSQTRQSHAVPWRMAFAKLWPQTLAGCVVLIVVATKSPHDVGFALMGTTGLILAAPFAVATASPLLGQLFARIGICRICRRKKKRRRRCCRCICRRSRSTRRRRRYNPSPSCSIRSERYEELSAPCASITATAVTARPWTGSIANSCGRAIWSSTSARMSAIALPPSGDWKRGSWRPNRSRRWSKPCACSTAATRTSRSKPRRSDVSRASSR